MLDIFNAKPHLFLGSRLKRLAEQMQADTGAFNQRAGLAVPPGLFAVLAAIEERGPQMVGGLAEALGVSQPAMTKSVAKLASAGLLEARRGDADKRQLVVTLTQAGRAALEEGRASVWPLVDAAVRDVTSNLSGSFIEQLEEIERRLEARSLSDRAAAKADVVLEPASDADVPAIVRLLNQAYRGSGAGASWNTEATFMDGDRTSEALLRRDIAEKPAATMQVWKLWGVVQGCVWLEPMTGGDWYLGSLAVSPSLQDAQAGRRLLAEAEAWVLARGGTRIRMTVINVREGLIAWYERRGYRLTGESETFPYADDRFGRPRRPDLCFVVMAKDVKDPGA
jgi:DNA-binding MarR family transcriptional regulator